MTVKGQLVIPSKIRRKFGIKEGTRVQVDVDEQAHRIILTPVTRDYIQKLRGKYKGNKGKKKKKGFAGCAGRGEETRKKLLMPRKSKALVLDSWAALAYLGGEASSQAIADLIASAHEDRIPMCMSTVN